MRKSSGQYCSAIGCSMNFGTKQDISLFSFPNPKCKSGEENVERSKQWVLNCRRQDLLSKSAEYLNRNCCFCAKHFEDNQFMNANLKKRLVHDAVPTIFPEIPNAVKRIRLKRQISTFEGVLPAPVKKKLKLKTGSDSPNTCNIIPDEIERNEGDSSQQTCDEKRQKSCSCLIDNCKSNYVDNPNITFFVLPIKDEKRRKQWLENIGKLHLISQFQDKGGRLFVCEKHFEPSQFATTRLNHNEKQKRLTSSAVPTIFPSGKTGKWQKKTAPSQKAMVNSSKETLMFSDNSTQTTALPILESSIKIFNSSKFPFILKCDEINRSQWRFDDKADENVAEDDLIIEVNLEEENLKSKIIIEANDKNMEDFPSVLDYHNRILMSGIWDFFKQNVETDFQLCWTNENGEEITTNVHHVVLSAFCSSLKNISEKKFKLNTKLNNDEIEGLVEFLYCGRLDLSNGKTENVLNAGKELGFQLLIDTIS